MDKKKKKKLSINLGFKSARRDETARVPYEQRGRGGSGPRAKMLSVLQGAYEMSSASTPEDAYKAYKEPSVWNVGAVALGAIPGGKLLKGPLKAGAEYVSKKIKKRDWQNIPLSHRGKSDNLTRKFLDEHGYKEYDEFRGGKRDFTYSSSGTKTVAHTPWYDPKTKKKGTSIKTFKNPTLKSLRSWMGY